MKRISFGLTGILILAFTPGWCQEKNYILENISLEHGLSQSVVETIVQDRRGFLWFGTQDGLNLYNGYSFKVFKNDPYDAAGLSQNYITALFEDREGTIWIGTERGLNYYRHAGVHRWVSRRDRSVLNDNFNMITGDSSGVLWMATSGNGLMRLDTRTDDVTYFKNNPDDPHSLIRNTVLTLYLEPGGALWIGSPRGLSRLEGGTFTNYSVRTSGKQLPDERVQSIIPAGKNQLWIGTTAGLWLLDTRSMDLTVWRHNPRDPHSIPSDDVTCLFVDSDSTLWIGTSDAGVAMMMGGRFVAYRNDPANPYSLSHNEVGTIFEDRSGNVWVGTVGGGVNKFRKTYFKIYSTRTSVGLRLPASEVWSMVEDRQGVLWIGTHGLGICRYDQNGLTVYQPDPSNPRSLSDDRIMCLFEDSKGRLWAGTTDGLNLFDGNGWKVIRGNANDPQSLPNNYVNRVMEDSRKRLWMATFGGGLARYEDGKFIRYQNVPHDSTSISSDDVFCLVEDRQGYLWAGTFDGLNRFDGRSFTQFRKKESDRNSLSQNTVLSLAVGSDSSLWIGTDGGGLNRYKDGRFTIYMEKDGLASNLVYGIVEANDGTLWLSTNAGLCRFDPNDTSRTRFKRFDTKDGLPSNEFNQGGYFKGSDGELFFGCIKGMVRFHPEELIPRVFVPPIYITAFRKFDHEVAFPFEITELDCVEISYRDNFFAFEFTSLDYTVPEKNQYAYKLEGFDEDWVYSGSRRYASYTNLDGGTYRFMVKGANSDGVWNDQPAVVTVIIHPPFWKTFWFQFLALFGAGVLAYGFYRSRVSIMEHRNIILEQKVRERTKQIELKNEELETKNKQIRLQQDQLIQSEKLSSLGRLVSGMSHEINNPLNFTYGNAVNLEYELEEVEKLIRTVVPDGSTAELSGRFKEMSDMLRTIKKGTGRIKDIVVGLRDFAVMYDSETTEININTLVDYLIGIIRSQERKNVDIQREAQDLPPVRGLQGQLSHAIMNILRNAVEAAQTGSERTGRGKVVVRTSMERDWIVLSIRDNGPGIPDEIRHKIFEPFFTTKEVGQGTGLGLSISYGIIRNHKGEITFVSDVGLGTEFRIQLPLVTSDVPVGGGNLS